MPAILATREHVTGALQIGLQGQAEQGPCAYWDNQARRPAASPDALLTSQKVASLSSRQVEIRPPQFANLVQPKAAEAGQPRNGPIDKRA